MDVCVPSARMQTPPPTIRVVPPRSSTASEQRPQIASEPLVPEARDEPRIKVCVRVRPFIPEIDNGRGDTWGVAKGQPLLCVAMPSRTSVQLMDPRQLVNPDEGNERFRMRTFEFDRCYWSHSADHPLYATQATVFEELGSPMVQQAMDGYNSCIFAYGQTGSGKSFSLLGGMDGEDVGLLPRLTEELFAHLEAFGKALVSFYEIYNEKIQDLLNPKSTVPLEVKSHPSLGHIVPNLTEVAVVSNEDVMELMDFGSSSRHVSPTAMNSQSSRSHCIFTIKTFVTVSSDKSFRSHMNVVDLAGSERASQTQATGQRLVEGASINRSLSTLSRVIFALAEGEKPPFRESKLTLLLKESLSGNSRTAMLAAISPCGADHGETHTTLKFAQSVKSVKLHATRNEVVAGSENESLIAELGALREQLRTYEAAKDSDAATIQLLRRRLEESPGSAFVDHQDEEEVSPYSGSFTSSARALSPIRPRNLAAANFSPQLCERGVDARRRPSLPLVCGLSHAAESEELEFEQHRSVDQVAVRGFAASRMLEELGTERAMQEAFGMSERLKRLEAETAEAEKAVEVASASKALELELRAMVAVDARSAEAELVVRASRHHRQQETSGRNSAAAVEWLPQEEFRRRLDWLRKPRPGSQELVDDAWAAAASVSTPLACSSTSTPAPLSKVDETDDDLKLGSTSPPNNAHSDAVHDAMAVPRVATSASAVVSRADEGCASLLHHVAALLDSPKLLRLKNDRMAMEADGCETSGERSFAFSGPAGSGFTQADFAEVHAKLREAYVRLFAAHEAMVTQRQNAPAPCPVAPAPVPSQGAPALPGVSPRWVAGRTAAARSPTSASTSAAAVLKTTHCQPAVADAAAGGACEDLPPVQFKRPLSSSIEGRSLAAVIAVSFTDAIQSLDAATAALEEPLPNPGRGAESGRNHGSRRVGWT